MGAYAARLNRRIRGKDQEHNVDKEKMANKGVYTRSCNRFDCQKENSAYWFNVSTRAYYCRECAKMINKDSQRFDNMQLCYYAEDVTQAAELQSKTFSEYKFDRNMEV